jgi:D-lactate dehydrogenase (cytochrome)
MQAGVEFARVEFLDEVMVRACYEHSKLSLAEKPMLFVEFTGTDESVREQSQRFAEITPEFEAASFEWATLAEERSRLSQARHNVFWAAKSYRPGADIVVSDVCVPIPRITDCVTETKKDLEQEGLIAPIVGHVGDGNFHACILVNIGIRRNCKKRSGFWTGLRSARSPWMEPALANMALGKVNNAFWLPNLVRALSRPCRPSRVRSIPTEQ